VTQLPREYQPGRTDNAVYRPPPLVARAKIVAVVQPLRPTIYLATVKLTPVPADQRWWVEYLVVATTGTAATTVKIFLADSTDPIDATDPAATKLFDLTDDGLGHAFSYPRPRQLPPDVTMTAVFTGTAAGEVASLRVEHYVEKV
jgi:hypothetical protein